MILKYDIDIDNTAIKNTLKKLTNQLYKLLPSREEGLDWEKPLTTLIEEMAGMERLIQEYQEDLFLIYCKMEGLFILTKEEDFMLYRRTIFECLGLINNIIRQL